MSRTLRSYVIKKKLMVYIGTLLAEPDACVSSLLILLYINSIISKVTYAFIKQSATWSHTRK